MSQITLLKAFRIDKYTVKCLYKHKELRQEFVIEWNNIHPGSGEIVDYDLQIDCLSGTETLNERIENAIREGEKGEDADLYIELRDTFNANDCEELQ